MYISKTSSEYCETKYALTSQNVAGINASHPDYTAEIGEMQIKGYPPGYGADTCSQHDLNLKIEGFQDCTVDKPPGWCSDPWCYVGLIFSQEETDAVLTCV